MFAVQPWKEWSTLPSIRPSALTDVDRAGRATLPCRRASRVAVVLTIAAGSSACAGAPAAETGTGWLMVAGKRVSSRGVATVADALRSAHVPVPSGVWLSARDGHRLGSDGRAGVVLRGGEPVPLSAPVRPGDRLRVLPGADAVEPVRTLVVAVPSTLPTPLFRPGRPGRARVTRGVVSGEMLARVLLRAPSRARLMTQGAITLTFDDGPDPRWTPRILRVLRKARVRAVFCVIGRQAARYPRLLAQIRRDGHVLCNQSWDHDLRLADEPDARIRANLRRTNDAVSRTGPAPWWFRAPGGGWSPRLIRLAGREGLAPLSWTVDTRDWQRPPVQVMRAIVQRELRPGGVILLHDGGGDRRRTFELVTAMLRELPARGYRFVVPPPR